MARFQVAIARGDDYSRLNDAFAELKQKAGLAAFAEKVRGKKVLVKPNMLGTFKPDLNVTTNPELVRLVVRWLRSAGAEVMVGDNCGMGGYGINERAARITGILEASEGAYLNIARDLKEIEVSSRFFKKLMVSRPILEADFIVNLPKLKTHTLTLLTVGIKNMFGMVAGAGKSRVHALAPAVETFGEAIADIFQVRPPDLCIVDGVMGMDGNGPTWGRSRRMGCLIASENSPAADLVIAKMAGLDPKEVHHLWITAERGLGPKQIEEVEINGELRPIPRFKPPTTIARRRFLSFFVKQFVYQPIIKSRLLLNPDKCSGCKICLESCPTRAMGWNQDHPEIDQEKCIRCFCCYELCGEGAWEVAGLLKRMRGKLV